MSLASQLLRRIQLDEKITMDQRRALSRSDFALPGKGTGKGGVGPGSYPIDTEKRARAALSYGSRFLPKAQLDIVKRKVRARYPNIHVSD